MAGIIPERAPPDEGVSDLARDGCHLRSVGAELELHCTQRARVDHGRHGAPAIHHRDPGTGAIDAAGRDRQSRRDRLYPLPRRCARTRLPAHQRDVGVQRIAHPREQRALGGRIDISREQHRAAFGGHSEHAMPAAAARHERVEIDPIPVPPGIPAAFHREPRTRPDPARENAPDATLES
jgi:hypothetical protein